MPVSENNEHTNVDQTANFAVDMDNGHVRKSRDMVVDGKPRTYEYLHQQRPGECVLVNFLNTWSFVFDGVLPLRVHEVRLGAMNLRKDAGIRTEDIQKIDSGLTQEDAVLLFSKLSDGDIDWIEDVLPIEGGGDLTQRMLKSIDILEYLDTYPSGVCVAGLMDHSVTIIKLKGNAYAFLDPANAEGVRIFDTDTLVSTLSELIKDRQSIKDYFYFVRGSIKGALTPNSEVSLVDSVDLA